MKKATVRCQCDVSALPRLGLQLPCSAFANQEDLLCETCREPKHAHLIRLCQECSEAGLWACKHNEVSIPVSSLRITYT